MKNDGKTYENRGGGTKMLGKKVRGKKNEKKTKKFASLYDESEGNPAANGR